MDDDIFNTITSTPPQTIVPQQQPIDNLMGGISFNPQPQAPVKAKDDFFDMLGSSLGGPSVPPPQPVSQPNFGGFGGDLLGFGTSPQPTPIQQAPVVQPQPNIFGGADLMGFGIQSPPPQQVPQNNGGFNFGVPSQPQPVPQPPAQNNFGFSLLGESQPVKPVNVQSNPIGGFQPIVNNNPNKILAYDNQHVQIWMDCIK
jgi:hypothetical protein